ncbi:tRNA pseudouridine(55) synthase TruB [Salininema proteolyticum]|uniref:tRNA pseudouridine synthase B n=1 Tax=Salininema proteolyticum TaxID=1607685 RepID=A0ABV8U0X6_9ACTN
MTDEAGFAIVDKPQGITSHGVVAAMRRLLGTRKVGHGGTLDPMATGLLVVAVNKGTKLLTYVSGLDKTYDATIRLGEATSTDDAEGETVAVKPAGDVSEAAVREALAAQTGEIDQVPSSVSAVKIDGKRAYQRVRDGEEVVIKPRRVRISAIDVHAVRREGEFTDVDVTVACSSGTYIRSIARDAGEALGVGGHLTALRRTSIGPFRLDRAKTLGELEEAGRADLLPMGSSASLLMPSFTVSADEVRRLVMGQKIRARGEGGVYALVDDSGDLVAVGRDKGERVKTEIVVARQV